jgi:hypothetical protein
VPKVSANSAEAVGRGRRAKQDLREQAIELVIG